jgi:hypothetical protein
MDEKSRTMCVFRSEKNLIGSGIDVAAGELVGTVPVLLLLQEFTLQNKWHVAKFLDLLILRRETPLLR